MHFPKTTLAPVVYLAFVFYSHIRTHNSTEYVGGHVFEEYTVADELDLMVLLNGCKMNGHVKIEDVWYYVPGMCLHTAMKVVRMGDDSIMGLLDAATNKEPIHEASVDGENEDSDEDGESVSEDSDEDGESVSEDSDAVVVTFVSSEDEGAEDGNVENEVTGNMLAGKQDARNEVADNEVAENEVPGDMLTVNEDARNGNGNADNDEYHMPRDEDNVENVGSPSCEESVEGSLGNIPVDGSGVNMVEDVDVNGEVRNEGQGINDRHEVQEGEGINVPQENRTEVPNDANPEHMQPQNTTQASILENLDQGQSPHTQTSTVDQVGAGDRNVAGGRGRGGGGGRGRGRGSGRGSGRGAGVTSNLEQPPHVGSEETQLNPQIG
ncbi:hypothetical protein Tsubulata_039010 [Turnera subulata]|uniref:Uncharacterized protein n=1 Tax=Turnera subulata TaxID=218843 RepID=A0A9Q0FQJ4_9ROSI|nr:hypothetical protein Tsubulata_039010 [Turnera subulata]